MYLEYHHQPGQDTGDIVSSLPHIAISLTESIQVERWLDGCFYRQLITPGASIIVPADAIHRCQWRNVGSFVVLSFEPYFLEQVGQDIVNCDDLELIPQAELHDPHLFQAFCRRF